MSYLSIFFWNISEVFFKAFLKEYYYFWLESKNHFKEQWN